MQNGKRRPHQENKEYSALQWGFWPTTRLLFNWDSTLAADNRVSQHLQLSIYLPFSSIGIPVWRIDRRSKQNTICTNRSKHLPQVFVVRHGSCIHLTFLFSLPFPLSHHKSKPYFRYTVIIRSLFFLILRVSYFWLVLVVQVRYLRLFCIYTDLIIARFSSRMIFLHLQLAVSTLLVTLETKFLIHRKLWQIF